MFEDKTYSFNKTLVFMILILQYIPFLVLIFADYNMYFDIITIFTQFVVLVYHMKIEIF